MQNPKWLRLSVLAFALMATVAAVSAQQPSGIYRLGYLAVRADPGREAAFRERLRELGYVEGKNLFIESRYADSPDQLSKHAAEIVGLRVDAIVVLSTSATIAAQSATATIPIIMIGVGDPVKSGFVKNLSRPGGNITGTSALSPELSAKRLELLKEAFPKVVRVGVLKNTENPATDLTLSELEAAAPNLGLKLRTVEYRTLNDLKTELQNTRQSLDALNLLRGIGSVSIAQLADAMNKSRLPSMHPVAEFAEAGGLIAYGVNNIDLSRRAATYVDRILKGTKPADLPVEQPTKFELVINLKTAKQIGLTIPPNVLARADRVIR